jgi:hypothetical protein
MNAVTALLKSLRADLLDRRMLPLVLAVVVVLIAAVGYAAFGSAGTVQAPLLATVPAAGPALGTTGPAVSQVAKGTTSPVSEVTSGALLQHAGPTRDPLAVPASVKAAAKKAAAKNAAPAGKVSGSSGVKPTPSKAPAATVPASTPKPAAPKAQKAVHKVDLFFGIVPAGTTAAVTGLHPYGNLVTVTPLPSASENLIELVAVSGSIKAARFKFIKPMIPTGVAKCIPSPTQCESIDLKPGQFEDLEYAPAGGGPAVIYQLQLFSITTSGASAASVAVRPRS